MDLFAKLDTATLASEPFPHAIVSDLVDPDLCRRLLRELPRLETLARGADLGNNRRFETPALDAFDCAELSPLWRETLHEGLGPNFMGRALRKLLPSIDRRLPDFAERFGARPEALPIRIRRKGKPQPGALSVDARIVVNTPATTPGTIARGPHLDKPHKLFGGSLFLRHEDDPSTGGELEFYESLAAEPQFERGRLLPRNEVRLQKTVPYRANQFAMFLNTPRSLHGAAPRSVTPYPRVVVDFVCEVWAPLFDVPFREGEEDSEAGFDGSPPPEENWLSGWRGRWKRKVA